MSAARSVISCAIAARSVDHRSCRAWRRALRLESIPLLLTPDLPAGQSCFLLFDYTLTSQVEVYDDHRCCCVAGDVTLLGPLAQFLGRLLLLCQELADEPHQ